MGYNEFLKYTFCLLLLTVLVGCNKNSPGELKKELPPLTHEGKNLFACKVNDEVWVARTSFSIGGSIPLEGEYNEVLGTLWLKGVINTNSDSVFQFIRFYGIDIYSTDSYQMDVLSNEITGFRNYRGDMSCGAYFHDENNKGTITITHLDTLNDIISGTFEMDLLSHESCATEVLKITNGRFDMGY
ncbi:MAG: hypothetical protein GQ574_17975 [Crocinitomix sp.]|nr:hypothetical protein [Crocinitomix sp.]